MYDVQCTYTYIFIMGFHLEKDASKVYKKYCQRPGKLYNLLKRYPI